MRFITIAATLLTLAPLSITAHAAENCPTNLIPMYEGVVKNAAMLKADEEWRRSVADQGFTQQQGAQRAVDNGWTYFLDKGDPVTAMKRFNQGWLLDTDNGGAYHGMAVMSMVLNEMPDYASCPFSADKVDALFLKGVTSKDISPGAHADYGRFLVLQQRPEEAIAHLKTALEMAPNHGQAMLHLAAAYEAVNDYGLACKWAKQALAAIPQIPRDAADETCAKADNP